MDQNSLGAGSFCPIRCPPWIQACGYPDHKPNLNNSKRYLPTPAVSDLITLKKASKLDMNQNNSHGTSTKLTRTGSKIKQTAVKTIKSFLNLCTDNVMASM